LVYVDLFNNVINLGGGTSDFAGNTTGVLSVLEVDETILSPRSSPGVSDDPITTRVRRISSKLNSVINAKSALAGIQNTTSVVLPWLSITADGKRHLGELFVDGTFILSNGNDLSNVQGGSARALLARTVFGSVGVAALSILASLLHDPVESLARISSVATGFSAIAVDDFLRAEGHDLSTGHEIGRFDGFGGGESPAGTALFLVLNGSGHSLGDPIDGRHLRNLEGGSFVGEDVGDGTRSAETKHGVPELFRAHVSELGETKSSGSAVGIKFLNLGTSHQEVVESVGLLFGSV